MKEMNPADLWKVGGGLDASECVSDSVNGFAVGVAVGGAVGMAAGAAGAAIGGLVGGLAGGAAAMSDNAACGTGDGASSAASAASAACSADATSCGPGDGVGGSDGGGGGGGGGKVICTELCRMGAIDTEIWLADLRYSQRHFSARTLRGYHLWGIPFVRLMRRHPVLARLALPPTRWFAEDIAHRMGVRPAPNWKGWAVREMLFRPLCSVLGLFARARDTRTLWAMADSGH